MAPDKLAKSWREGRSRNLRRRRAVVGLSLFNVAAMSMIALYQVGLLKHVPEPKVGDIDADAVNGSPEAYAMLDTPDAVLAVGSFAATAFLGAAGGPDRPRTKPWLPLLMSAKSIFDAVFAVGMIAKEVPRYKKLCLWCLLTAASSAVAAALGIAEGRSALRTLTEKGSHKT